MDFKALKADEDHILSRHFSSGRSGRGVSFIGIHYEAGDLSLKTVYDVWQTRQASAHYAIDSQGRCGQYVWERDTAWALGNWDANCRSISIEHANQGDTITDACRETGAHLVAALCLAHKLGRPEWGKNVRGHMDFAATSCPGPLYGVYKESYIKRCQEWYDAMSAGTDAPVPSQPPQPAQPSSPSGASGFGGAYTCMVDALNVRTAPALSAGVVAQYGKGQTVVLNDWYKVADGYVWGRYTGGSGNIRYIAVGRATGKVEGDDYLVKGGTPSSGAPASQVPAGAYRVLPSVGLKVRTGAGTGYAVTGVLPSGYTVNLDGTSAVANGHVWGRYTAYSGGLRWIAVRTVGGSVYAQKV